MPPALVEVLSQLKREWKSQFVFPEVYQSYRELPVEVRKEWSCRYKDGLRRGLAREEARRVAWQAVRGCQKPDRPIDPDRLTDLVPRLVKQAGLPHCTTHDLRRTFCTYLAACGTDILAAQKLAGHSNPTVNAKSYVQPVLELLNAQKQLPYWNVQASPQLYATAATRPTGEFRRLVLALRQYRQPTPRRLITFVKQQNLVAGACILTHRPCHAPGRSPAFRDCLKHGISRSPGLGPAG